MRPKEDLVLLVHVDNTLLDNDLVKTRMKERLDCALSPGPASRLWEIYENVCETSALVDFPATIQRFREEQPDHPEATRLEYLVCGFPFPEVVYGDTAAGARNLGRDRLRHRRTSGSPRIPHSRRLR